jgi:hypothetical protein
MYGRTAEPYGICKVFGRWRVAGSAPDTWRPGPPKAVKIVKTVKIAMIVKTVEERSWQ